LNTLPTLAIVIVSYDSAAYLPECLTTLLANVASYPTQVQLALVENGNKAAQSKTLAVIQPFQNQGLQYFVAPSNLGYGGGTNFGWEKLSGDIFIVLNPDMSFPAGWLQKFVQPFAETPQIGIVGCKLLTREGKIQHAGGLVKYEALLGEHFGAGETDDGRWDESAEVEFVTGAALAIRQELKDKLGGFDPAYFPGYYEDVDLCWRARQLGYKVWYEAGAKAYHYEGGTFGRSAGYYEAYHRNRLRFAQKSLATRQFFNEFLPAERQRLTLTPPGPDLSASRKVYRQMSKNGAIMPEDENPVTQRLPDRLTEVKKSWLVEEKPFRSRLPLVATLRERFNNISTRWYIKPILQQQVDYNAAVARAVEDLGQLALANEASHNLEIAVLTERFVSLEERLERIEVLLSQIVEKEQGARMGEQT